jgi:hypothetical protein
MALNTNGDFGIGDSLSGYRLAIKTGDSTASTYATLMRNSSSTNLFAVRSDGYFSTGTAAISPYNNTTTSAPNVYVDSGGQLFRSTATSGGITSIATNNGLTGGTITSTGTLGIDTNNNGGIGSYRLGCPNTSAGIADGGTLAGSSMRVSYGGNGAQGNTFNPTSTALSGTWRNMSGIGLTYSTYDGANSGILMRIA